MKLTPDVVLYAGLAFLIAGMILVVLGVLGGALFLPGVVVLLLGLLTAAAAGLFAVFRPTGHA